jgi:hypothetical protein
LLCACFMTRLALLVLLLVRLADAVAAAEVQHLPGMCDASAVVMLDDHTILVVQDEANVAGVYDLNDPSAAPKSIAMRSLLELSNDKEADLEGLARSGDTIFWTTSFGRNSDGEAKKNRLRVGSATLERSGDDWTLKPNGFAKKNLRTVLETVPEIGESLGTADDDPQYAPEKAGLNIEGLAVTPGGDALIVGVRNPIPANQALIVRVLLKDWPPTIAPNDVSRVDLGKRGIRSIDWDAPRKRYVIVAGPKDGNGSFEVYEWSVANTSPVKVATSLPDGFRPEGLALKPDGTAILVSDDGDVPFPIERDDECAPGEGKDGSCPCKHLEDKTRQRFRLTTVALP